MAERKTGPGSLEAHHRLGAPENHGKHGTRHLSAGNVAKLFGGQIGSKIFGFLAFAWLSRILSPTDYGLVETVVGMTLIGYMCIEFGTGTIGVRAVARGEGKIDTIAQSVVSARLILALVSVPLLVLVYASLLSGQAPVMLVVLFGLSLFALIARHDWLFIAKARMGIAVVGVMLKMAIFLLCIVVFPPSNFGLTVVGWAECFAMAVMAIFFMSCAPLAGCSVWKTPEIRAGFRMVQESASLGTAGLVNSAGLALPILLVTVFAGASEGGQIAAAQRIIVSLSAFAIVYYQALLPLLVSRLHASEEQAQALLDASDRILAWSGVAASVFLFLAAESIMITAFGQNLTGSGAEFSLVVWSIPLMLAQGGIRAALIAQNRQKAVLQAQLIGAGFTLAIAASLAPFLGGEGAAAAFVMGLLVLWLVSLYYGRNCAVRSDWTIYVLPIVVGVAVIVVGRILLFNPWQEALLGSVVVVIFAALNSDLRHAVRTFLMLRG